MKRGYPPVWLCAALLALALLWNMLGAPVSLQQLNDLKTPLTQARILMPSRLNRVLRLWMPVQIDDGQQNLLREEGMAPGEREMAEMASAGPVIEVYLSPEQGMAAMPLESYVCGVVAAEVPAAYHAQALRAQAVAARTRALAQIADGGCKAHPGADICAFSGCCQGYASASDCMEKWGEEYGAYRARIVEAVAATADELLTYEGQPITVLYHAISGGKTEDVQAVFSQSLPYLVSVDSHGEEDARGYLTDSFFSFQEVARLLNAELFGGELTPEAVRGTLAVGDHTGAGRVDTVLVDGREIKATALRGALGLRSTWFTISMNGDGVTFHQRGYGHGVGMSQAGANAMAADGHDYRAILAHYYPGALLEKR